MRVKQETIFRGNINFVEFYSANYRKGNRNVYRKPFGHRFCR